MSTVRNDANAPMAINRSLADKKIATMKKGADEKDPVWMREYMESLINPFSMKVKAPKLLDGEVKYTAGIKLRATGEIVCSTTGNTNIILFPGLTNVICYCTAPTGDDDTAAPLVPPLTDPVNIDSTIFRHHISTDSDRATVRLARLTGAGVRFFLTNSAEEDDGYWEACRLTAHNYQGNLFFKNDTTNTYLGTGLAKVLATDYEQINNSTYQFGQLRDFHKYVFKLNSQDNDHKFSPVSSLNASAPVESQAMAYTDISQWDMIFIKIRGRRNAASPSVLRFDSVANQEIVYAENSPLSRMMDENVRNPNIEGYLEYSRVALPAFQIAP